jgi:hypothetical protein
MTMGRFIRSPVTAPDGDGAEILTSRSRGSSGGPAELRAAALWVVEANK